MGKFRVLYKDENVMAVETEALTIIAVYIRPQAITEEVIETIMPAIDATKDTENVIIAGDINCRIDKANNKTEIVMEALREEGFTLANRADMITYVAHNGTSAIDLLLYRGKTMRAEEQKGLWNSDITPIRKHIPIETTMRIMEGQQKENKETRTKMSRALDMQKLSQNQNIVEEARERIKSGQTDTALEMVSGLIRSACRPATRRRAQPWFDKTCYEERKSTLQALNKAKITRKVEDLDHYARRRKQYKTTIKTKKGNYMEEEARRRAEEAENNPFLPLKRKAKSTMKEIPIDNWENHFSRILNKENKNEAYDKEIRRNRMPTPMGIVITESEVVNCIREAKIKKATGPDQIAYEHLKATTNTLKQTWTEIFNECLKLGTIPNQWRRATLKILYKGKGSTEDMNSYRGVALENTTFKIFMKIITNKLTALTQYYIPECQFGFRKGKSTLQAATLLLGEIEDALSKPKGKFYTVFIDYEKAFDSINREKLILKLKNMIGSEHPLAKIIQDILRYNQVRITDEVTTSDDIMQTNGVMQGDPLSPLLFNIMTSDIGEKLNGSKLIMYADDMALGARNKEELQDDLNTLQKWAEENHFKINKDKTVQMVFRRGGRVSATDNIKMREEPLKIVNKFTYLGLTIQTTTKSFSAHTQERTSAAIRAMCTIRNITQLKLETAIRLFKAVIIPIATYGIEITWEKLTVSDLEKIEKVKARFLKRAIGAGKNAPNRMIYMLTRETFFLEDIRLNMLLPATRAYKDAIARRKQKEREIDANFFGTDAMIYRGWTNSNQPMRYAIIGSAIHGFHHKMCTNERYHQPNEQCVCKMCNEKCELYHFKKCKERPRSLSELIKTNQ